MSQQRPQFHLQSAKMMQQSVEQVRVRKSILKDYFNEISNECRQFEYKVCTEEIHPSRQIFNVEGLQINSVHV